MHPLLRQRYESALGALSLAQAIRKRAVGSLSLAVSASVDPGVVAPHMAALKRQFVRLQVRRKRGRGEELVEMLKAGEAEFAVAEGSLEAQWERIDH
jgi:DNA-binding transcriptional LysR family regulator